MQFDLHDLPFSLVKVNGFSSFDEFLEEELLEPFSLSEGGTGDEPFEKDEP